MTFFTAIKESQKLCDNGVNYVLHIYMKLQVSIFANDSQQKKIKIYVHNNIKNNILHSKLGRYTEATVNHYLGMFNN